MSPAPVPHMEPIPDHGSLELIIIKSFIDHAPLIIGILVMGWWLFPKLFRNMLNNGSGDIIRRIFAEENAVQAKDIDKRFRDAIKEHEGVEETRMREVVDGLKDKLADQNDRLLHVEERLGRKIRSVSRKR